MGVGGAGIIAGSVLGGLALSTLSKAEGECPAPYTKCSGTAISERGTAGSYATASTAALIAGAALAVGGATVYLTAPHASGAAMAVGFAPGTACLLGSF